MTLTDFDPELYLRLLGERALAAGENLSHPRRRATTLPEAAEALAVTGVVSPALAEQITSDYALASLVSQESPMLEHRRQMGVSSPAAAADPQPVVAQRTYALDVGLDLPGGRLRISVFTAGPGGGRLQAEFISDTELGHHGGGGPPTLTVRLPSGQRTQTSFGGSWSDFRATGHFSFDSDVSGPLPWVEIAGHRVELAEPAPPSPVEIELLGPAGRAMRYLWLLVADFNGEHNHSGLANHAASDALLRAGVIAADDPELTAVLWVADTQAGHGPGLRRHRRGQPAPVTGIPAEVPAAWRSVLGSPVPAPGPEGTLALAAATPVFGHLSVALNALRSGRENATLEITATDTLFRSVTGPVAFWAEDDRGNHYLGESASWSGRSGGITTGEVEFGPLHPKAHTLTVAVTSLDARALIPIALDWPDRDPSP